MLIYKCNTHKQGHTDSAISLIFALPYLRSLRYAEAFKSVTSSKLES